MRNQVFILALIFSLLIVIGSIAAASAADVKTSQINVKTSNVGYYQYKIQENPDISGNIVVYRKTTYPGTGSWSMDDPVTSIVYWKNIATGSTAKVRSTTTKQWNPKISGTRVIWQEGGIHGPYSIYVKNLATGTIGKITSSSDYGSVDISGTRVIWELNNHLYLKNLATGSGGIVTSGSIYNPAISGVRVVWTDDSFNRVYVKNIQTGATGSIYSNEASSADISGDIIVWQYFQSNPYTSIYWKNIHTGVGGFLSNGGAPKISGNWVVWQIEVGYDVVIYAKNLVTKSLVKVNQQHGGQFSFEPEISGNIVVWQDWKPYLFVDYWKNVLTKAGGRVQN
jgi:beta propeller repeat protein